MSQETLERIFDVSQPVHLKVGNVRGSIDIQPGKQDQIIVTAVKYTQSGDSDRTRIEIIQENENSVQVKTHFEHDHVLNWLTGVRPCRIDYIIQTPSSCSVETRSVSNQTNIQGLGGQVKVKSVSGDITLGSIDGKLDIDAVSGNIAGTNLNTDITIKVVSGDVRIHHSHLLSIRASSVSGDTHLETSLGDGPYVFRSVSGDVQLTVPGDTSCSAYLTGISGHIQTDLPVTSMSRNRGSQYFEVQGGGVDINFNTVSGRLVMNHTGEVKWTPMKTREDRRAILQKIAQGEISVDEAVAHL